MENQKPLFALTRGEIIESVHFGSIAIADNQGTLIGWFGDPETVTYLRSSAKPFQALPFVTDGGMEEYNLTLQEIALICASHSGTDEHVKLIEKIQKKSGVQETQLLCGVHPVPDNATAEAMRELGEEPTPNHNNCSGKHSGMLAYARMQNWPTDDYVNPSHPVQQAIISTFSEMCDVPVNEIEVGVDGCSAPNFAIPLRNTALAFARLCDGDRLPDKRKSACKTIVEAMTSYPRMVAGADRFDTRLMEAAGGRLVSKGGAEGYQAIGLLPKAISPTSPGLGIAFKVSDGDLRGRARPAITLEILRQLQVLSENELGQLAAFGPSMPISNWQGIEVGRTEPMFNLNLIEDFQTKS